MRRFSLLELVAVLLFLGEFGVCFGILTRHDVDSSLYAAYANQFDSTCMITLNGVSIGSGVLITRGYVLTAAHVAERFNGHNEAVQLGNGRTVTVDRSLIHPSTAFHK